MNFEKEKLLFYSLSKIKLSFFRNQEELPNNNEINSFNFKITMTHFKPIIYDFYTVFNPMKKSVMYYITVHYIFLESSKKD